MTTKHASDPAFSEYTVCGLAYDAHESGDHDEQVLFAEDGEPVTCLKCREVVTEVRRIKLGRLPWEAKP